MGYFYDREREILVAMAKNNWKSPNGKQSSPEHVIDLMTDIQKSCAEYVDYVSHESQRIQDLRDRYLGPYHDAEDSRNYRNAVQDDDVRRRDIHDTCIRGFGTMNRICKANGLRPFTTVNTENPTPAERAKLADLIGQYGSEFTGGRASSMAEAMGEVRRKEPIPMREAQGYATDRLMAAAAAMAEKDGAALEVPVFA